MGLESQVELTERHRTTCPPTPERCEARSATATVESVSTESTLVDEVWLVVSITTESTSTSIIQVTSVRSVCDTSTSRRTSTSAQPSTLTTCGVSLARTCESNTPARAKPQLLTAPLTTSTRCWPRASCQTSQSS